MIPNTKERLALKALSVATAPLSAVALGEAADETSQVPHLLGGRVGKALVAAGYATIADRRYTITREGREALKAAA